MINGFKGCPDWDTVFNSMIDPVMTPGVVISHVKVEGYPHNGTNITDESVCPGCKGPYIITVDVPRV